MNLWYKCHIYTAGVYLSLGGVVGLQNTCASISHIGSSQPHQLSCITDRKPCCVNQGQWYYPNGSQVRDSSGQNSFYMKRTNQGSVNLFRPSNVLEPYGEFCCRITDAADVTHTLCIHLGQLANIVRGLVSAYRAQCNVRSPDQEGTLILSCAYKLPQYTACMGGSISPSCTHGDPLGPSKVSHQSTSSYSFSP